MSNYFHINCLSEKTFSQACGIKSQWLFKQFKNSDIQQCIIKATVTTSFDMSTLGISYGGLMHKS